MSVISPQRPSRRARLMPVPDAVTEVGANGRAGQGARPSVLKEAGARRWLGFVVVCLGMMMTFLNITETVSTLGPIHRNLHASSADLVWIASIYSMFVASLVLSAGTVVDI